MAQRSLTADVLPRLVEWLEYNLASGCGLRQLEQTLVDSGYDRGEAGKFLSARWEAWARRREGALFDAEPVSGASAAVARFWGRSDVLADFNRLSLGAGAVRILARNPALGIHFFADVLWAEECEALIRYAAPRLGPSAVLDEGDGRRTKAAGRTSLGAGLQRGANDLVQRIESRLAKLTDLPIAHGEGLQILRYGPGGQYRPHFDFFDPLTPGGARKLAQGGQRLATVILYLSEVESGGATLFPDLSLVFTPMRGAALVFPSLDRQGEPLRAALHAGCPVVSGEKWIATLWLRVSPSADGG